MSPIEIQAGDGLTRHIAYLWRGCSPPVRAADAARRLIEWSASERNAKRMLNYLLDVGIVPSIDQCDEGTIRFTIKEPGNAIS